MVGVLSLRRPNYEVVFRPGSGLVQVVFMPGWENTDRFLLARPSSLKLLVMNHQPAVEFMSTVNSRWNVKGRQT